MLKFISIGTPYLGAPRAYVTMRMGYSMGLPSIVIKPVERVADTMPAMYQLLPSEAWFSRITPEEILGPPGYIVNYDWANNRVVGAKTYAESKALLDKWRSPVNRGN